MNPRSFTQFGGTLSKNRQFSNEPLVILRKEDEKDLADFFELMSERIPRAVLNNQPIDPIEMGLQRYLDSLRSQTTPEEKLTYAIMGLEALLLENEDELRFRLSSRLAKLLGFLNEKPDSVFVDSNQSYSLRSTHVHGSPLTSEDRIRCQDGVRKMWRYLRKTILFFILNDITSDGKKRNFLKQLDVALIDDTKSQVVRQLCQTTENLARTALA